MENVIVNIGAETKDFLTGLSEVGESTQSLDDKLKTIGVEAAAAFAGFSAAIMGTVYAYGEQEKVGLQIESILQSTGGVAGVTSEAINELADSLSKSTTFSELQVKSAEEVLLTFTRIGKDTFPQATQATLDLATQMGGDAAGAAKILGRALEDPMNGVTKLTRAGIILTDQQKAQITAMQESGNIAGAQGIIIQAVEQRYGGMSQAVAGGIGVFSQLKNSMETLSEHIGGVFAPYVEQAALWIKNMVQYASENQGIVELISVVITAGAAITGTVTALIAAKFAVGQLMGVVETAKLVVEAFGLSARVAMGATGVGLLLVVGLEIYQHWQTVWPAMQEIFQTFVATISTAGQGLAKVLQGVFHLDPNLIKEGLAEAGNAFVQGAKDVGHTVALAWSQGAAERNTAQAKADTDLLNKNKELQKKLNDEQTQREIARGRATAAAQKAELDSITGHTAAVVQLEKEKASILQKLSDSNYAYAHAALQKQLAENQKEIDKAHQLEFHQAQTFQKLTDKQNTTYTTQERAKLMASIQDEEAAKHQNAVDDLNFQIQANNTFLQEEDRYGTAYAEIHKLMRSKEMEGAKTAFGEMSQFTQSSNETLKSIGKAASAANIMIKGIESAENIYAGFSTIPIIGPALGIAGAAAAMAFAAENEAKVLGLAQGGLVTGGIPGTDSVPAMLSPGELIVPQQNFNEVVNSVAQGRKGMDGAPQQVQVVVSFKGNASRFLQVQTVQDKALGIYRGT